MNWQSYKKDDELPLSKRLTQEFITSPLLNRGRQQPKKSKIVEKSPDVNFLFADEKRKLKTRRTEKLRKAFNLSNDIQEQVVRIKENKLGTKMRKPQTERVQKWEKNPYNTTLSYFVEVDTESLMSEERSMTSSEYTEASPGDSDEEENSASPEYNTGSPLQKDFRIITLDQARGTSPISKSSMARLKEQELQELLQTSEQVSSNESIKSIKKVTVSRSSYAKALDIPRGTQATINRQTSLLDLKLSGEGFSDLSMALSLMESEIPTDCTKRRTSCLFPGWESGQHCHSVSASIFEKGLPEPCLSSSSSSDDIFESTKYSRDIIEEKLRGLELEKKEEEDKSKEVKADEQMKKRKSKASSKCKCHKKKDYHSKCSKGHHSKIDKKFKAGITGGDEHSFREGTEKPTIRPAAYISSTDSESMMSYISKAKSCDESSVKADETPSENSVSSEKVAKRPCKPDTCPSLKKGAAGENLTENEKLAKPVSLEVRKCEQRDDVKLKKACSDMGEHSGTGSKSGVPCEVDSSAQSVTTVTEYCTPGTCQFAKTHGQLPKSDLPKVQPSKSEHSHRSSKKKEICAPKKCKSSKRRPKKRKLKARKFKQRMHSRRWKRKQRHFTCDCHTLYVDGDDSDTEDLWSDKDWKRSRKRRYNLMFEHVKKQAAKKCGGYVTEGHNCNCYICYIKEKPWKQFLKMPNAVLDIPYPLTTNSLKARSQKTSALLKKLSNKFNWSEENLKNYCTRHEICKKPTLRKSLLQENPFLWEWKWCHPHKNEKKVKKEAPKEEKSGRFGYYVKIKEERLTRGEHFTSIQKIIEKAVHCKWNQDVAEMKLNHFLENMPKQQTCYAEGKTFDPDKRTCHNLKLIERLSDIVKFNDDPDRGIHEFSFPPKLLKYQEPQLVGDIGTDMPEIRPVMEVAKSPTIYRDLFRDPKHDQRKLMDTLLPPLQWTDKAGLWEMKVSIEPDNDETNKDMIKYLNHNETLCHAINKNFCAGRYRLYFEVFAEVIRQELIDNPERAFLLARIREEFLLTMLLYDGGLEMTLVSTTHLWKDIEADIIDSHEKETLEKEMEELQEEIKTVMLATYDLERLREEQSQTRDYQNKDQEKLYKKTNHQLLAQFENIKAGLLYDLD